MMKSAGGRGGCTVSRRASCAVPPLTGAEVLTIAGDPSKGSTVAEATGVTEIRQLQPATIGVQCQRGGAAHPPHNFIERL